MRVLFNETIACCGTITGYPANTSEYIRQFPSFQHLRGSHAVENFNRQFYE